MPKILALATAGLKPEQQLDTEHKIYPRIDYVELKRFIDLDVLDYSAYNGNIGNMLRKLETKVRSDVYLAFLGLLRKRSYELVFSMSERAGLPFALLNRTLPDRKPMVSRITNWSSRQESMVKRFNLFPDMGPMTVMSNGQKRDLVALGAKPENVHVIHYAVDDTYFSPMKDIQQEKGLVLTLGEVRTRNYNLLFRAIDGLPMKLLVAASGYWYAREKNMDVPQVIPQNVEIAGRFKQIELREIYARAQFTVLPLFDVSYAAGVTATLETMSMGRTVIVTKSEGILDYVVDGETAIVVPTDDPQAMREAIAHLIAHPEEARRLGENARRRIEEVLNYNIYLEQTAQVLLNSQ